MFTMEEGAVSSYSRKVKLNTRSSTEMELVVADMYMPEMLWLLYFMESQGYKVECIGLHQDDTSTQLLMKKWAVLNWKEDQTHSSEVLLYQGQNQRRGDDSGELPN
jgi:hypothetical protein